MDIVGREKSGCLRSAAIEEKKNIKVNDSCLKGRYWKGKREQRKLVGEGLISNEVHGQSPVYGKVAASN